MHHNDPPMEIHINAEYEEELDFPRWTEEKSPRCDWAPKFQCYRSCPGCGRAQLDLNQRLVMT